MKDKRLEINFSKIYQFCFNWMPPSMISVQTGLTLSVTSEGRNKNETDWKNVRGNTNGKIQNIQSKRSNFTITFQSHLFMNCHISFSLQRIFIQRNFYLKINIFSVKAYYAYIHIHILIYNVNDFPFNYHVSSFSRVCMSPKSILFLNTIDLIFWYYQKNVKSIETNTYTHKFIWGIPKPVNLLGQYE